MPETIAHRNDMAPEDSMSVQVVASRKTPFGEWIAVDTRTVRLPGAQEIDVHVVLFPAISLVVAVDGDEVVLVRQFRFPPHTWILEAPAGRVEPGEDPATTALRELHEETGYRCGSLTRLGGLRIAPHLSDEMTHVFLARQLTGGDPKPQKGELLETRRVKISRLRSMIAGQELVDAKTIAAFALAGLLCPP